MLTGDELLRKRKRFLCELFEQGAISPNTMADPDDLKTAIDVDDEEFEALYYNLHDAKLIFGAPWTQLYLTDLGLKEVEAIQQVNKYNLTAHHSRNRNRLSRIMATYGGF